MSAVQVVDRGVNADPSFGLAPWYHYIPLKPDYSDLYDIMAFFVGPVDETGNIDSTKGHDVGCFPSASIPSSPCSSSARTCPRDD